MSSDRPTNPPLAALCAALLALVSCVATTSPPSASRPREVHAHGPAPAHGPLVHRFENAEAWAMKFDDPARDAWQRPEEVTALLEIEPGRTVADLGAGTGYFLRHLSWAVGEKGTVLALDIEPSMVRYMTERAGREGLRNVRPATVPFDDPKLPAGAVHRVLIVDTWHHIPDRTEYARKLAQGLAPGGAVFVVDFTLESKEGPPREHRVPPEQVVAELCAGGLEARVVEETLPEQYVVVGRAAGR